MAILDNIRNVMNKVIRIVCILLFAFMVIIGTYQILVRYIFNSPSTVSEELLTYSFTWMSLFAAAYVFGKREHMRMGFLADKLNKKKLTILNAIIEIIIIFFVHPLQVLVLLTIPEGLHILMKLQEKSQLVLLLLAL